jgi:exopolysaccharide production protein ExoZ
MTINQQRLQSVEIIRGIAALAIVFRHLLGAASVNHLGTAPMAGADIGVWGVDLFFVVSGFVMVYTQSVSEQGWYLTKGFLRRRLIRIVPLYWVLTLFYLALFLMMRGSLEYKPTADHVIASLLFVPWADSRGVAEPVIRVGWSLSYELLFYAMFGLLLLVPQRYRMSLLTGWLLSAVFAGALLQPANPALRVLMDSLQLEFLFGAWAGIWALRGGVSLKTAGFLLATGTLAVIAADVTKPDLPQWLIFGVPAACIVLGATSLEARSTQPWKATVTVWLGEISYALYLTHLLAIKGTAMLAARLPQNAYYATMLLVVGVAGAIALAGIVHHLVDVSLRRTISRLWPADKRRSRRLGEASDGVQQTVGL